MEKLTLECNNCKATFEGLSDEETPSVACPGCNSKEVSVIARESVETGCSGCQGCAGCKE